MGTTGVTVLLEPLESLVTQAHPEGGWGYSPGQAAHLEPTCLALLALNLESKRYAESIARGRQVLSRCASAAGTYRLPRGRPEAVWPTALVLFVQVVLDYPRTDIERTAAALLRLQGRIPESPEAGELIDIDCNLKGWPWAEGSFSWVEPTAWACFALSRAGWGQQARVEEGRRLLLDRAADEGGINYGNRRVLGRMTEPQMETTALMLLALQSPVGARSPDPVVAGSGDPATIHSRIAAAVAYLQRQVLASEDLEQLAWAKLALDLYRDHPGVAAFLPHLDERLRTAYPTRRGINGLGPAPMRQALTALALATERRNDFRLPQAVPEQPLPEKPSLAKTWPWSERLRTMFRGFIIEGAGRLRQPAPNPAVHIAPVADYNADLADTLQRQYENFRARVPLTGKRVVLKPNLVEYHRDKVINTHPHVVAAVIELCKREGAAEIIVAEGPGHCRNVEYLVRASGLGDVLRHYGTPFVDLNHDEPVKTLNLGRLTGLEHLYLSQTVTTAEVLISLPKLKTHHWAGATLSLKNLFGTLPGICYGWPKNELHWRGIDNSIVDIALTRTPDLAIVDGILGMEGDGPLNGTPRALGALIMGTDLVAVDTTCCRLMRLNPGQIGYLIMAQRKKLGHRDDRVIQQIGETIDKLAQPFETVPHLQPLQLGRSA
jgi:uncharacterized protein (DUF362 family)